MVHVDLLAQIPIFSGLDAANMEAIARVAHMRTYDRGECLFLEGEPLPPCFHILAAGTVQILKCAHSGKETAIRLIQPGEIFAWASMLDKGIAPATARAMTPVRVIKIPKNELMSLLAADPAVAMRLLCTLSERLRDVHEQLHAVVSERARTRLARLILRHQAKEGQTLSTALPHQVLARMAGITYEESVRIIGEWTHTTPPILAYGRGGKIAVLDVPALTTLAEGFEAPLAGTGS